MWRSGQAFWLLHRCFDAEWWSARGRGAAFAAPRPSVGRHGGVACRASQSPRGSDFIAWTEELWARRDTRILEFFWRPSASALRGGGDEPQVRCHDGRTEYPCWWWVNCLGRWRRTVPGGDPASPDG